MRFPIACFDQNLILNQDRQMWAIYRLQPWHYEHLGRSVRMGLLWRLSRLFWELQDHEAQLLMIPRIFRTADHLADLAERTTGPLHGVAADYCRQAADRLQGAREGAGYEYYIALRLPQAEPGLQLQNLVKDPKRWLNEFLKIMPQRLPDDERSEYLAREEMLYERINRTCRAGRPSGAELAWLVQRGFWRGVAGRPPEHPWEPAQPWDLRTFPAESAPLLDGTMDLTRPRQITITQDGAAGLTSFGYVSDLPDELAFPGCEWLFGLQDLPFPVEVCLRWSALPYDQALAAVRRKRLEIGDQDAHTRSAGEDVPVALMLAQEQVSELEHDLKERRFPTLLLSVSTAVSGRDQRELQERLRAVRSHLSTFQVQLEVPAGDQFAAFVDHIPGAPQQVKDYVHRVPPEVVAASMFLGSGALGDHDGPYIGRTGMLRRPVYLDPTLPPQLNRSASIAFLGSLGGGKSFSANLLTYLAVVFGGAQALVLDPKGERSNWPADLPELEGHVRVITLGPKDEDTGRLDPFVLSRGLDADGMRETGNLAVSLLSFLGNIPTGDSRFLTLMAAVEAVADEPQPSLGKVVDRLAVLGARDGAIAELAQYFRALSRRAYANLIFGRGDEQGLDLGDRLNVLQLQQLVMPPAGKPRADYSLEELLSVALMHAVTAFATQFTRRDRGTFKIVLLDEAWALLTSSQGRALVTHLLRTGRALNNAVYLVSQNVADLLDETLRNNVGMKLVFRSADQVEVERALQFLNLEADEENVATIRGLETGQALFQDLQGRVGVLTLDPVFPHLLRAFDTRPAVARTGREGGE